MIGETDKDTGRATARVTSPFKGVRDGEVYPRDFAPGDIIRGDLARAEVEAGRAEWTAPPKLENKERRPDNPTRTGADRSSSSPRQGRARTKTTSSKQKAKRGSSS